MVHTVDVRNYYVANSKPQTISTPGKKIMKKIYTRLEIEY